MVPVVERNRRCRVSGVAWWYPVSRRRRAAQTAPATTVRATSRSTLRGTDPARASVWKDRMDSARRCSMFIRRAESLDELFRGGGPVVGDDDGGGVPAEAGDDELPDGAGVVGQGDGFVDDAGSLVFAVAFQPHGCPGTGGEFGDVPVAGG